MLRHTRTVSAVVWDSAFRLGRIFFRKSALDKLFMSMLAALSIYNNCSPSCIWASILPASKSVEVFKPPFYYGGTSKKFSDQRQYGQIHRIALARSAWKASTNWDCRAVSYRFNRRNVSCRLSESALLRIFSTHF